MKRPCFICLLVCLTTTFLLSQSNPVPLINQSATVVPPISASQSDPKAQAKILDNYGKLPLSFEANHGQTDKRVKFLSRTGGCTLFLTVDEAVLALGGKRENTKAKVVGNAHTLPPVAATKGGGVLRMKLRNANPAAKVSGVDELAGKSNYFIGNDPAKWRTNVPTYAKVKYEGIYSGIDLVYYGNPRQLEYDFVVAPGADPHRIKFDVRGAKRIRRDAKGELVLKMGDGEIHWHKPVVYQEKDGERQEIAAHYVIKNKNRVGFGLAKYDTGKPLYIDPLIYSTYLGGSGQEHGYGIAVDSAGEAYVTGTTSSTDFPTTPGVFQPACAVNGNNGCFDGFVTKFNAAGTALVYSTFVGGTSSDYLNGIALDSSGETYITGYTLSPDFPTTSGAFQTSCPISGPPAPCYSSFVTKLDPSGSSLVYSTFLGGSGGSAPQIYTIGTGVAVDAAENAYVTGETTATGFPTTPNAFQTSCAGSAFECNDAFVVKLNPTGAALIYSTYLGGTGADGGLTIALDSADDAYIAGATFSTDFPTYNPVPGACAGSCGTGSGWDAFVTEINAAGSGLIYSTYLGGSSSDLAHALTVDPLGNAYVAGSTCSTDFPTSQGAFQASYRGGDCSYGGDAFVAELSPLGSALLYSTYLGGSGADAGYGIAVDASGNAYVTGYTESTDFPLKNPLQPANGGSFDAFVSELNPTGSALVYSTYLGGSGSDGGSGIAVDSSGNAYVTGTTSSTDFPLMNPMQPTYGGGGDAFVAKIMAVDVMLTPPSLNFGNEPIGATSTPQVSMLTNTGAASLTITSISVTGPNSSEFAETNTCGASVPAGGSCNISVTFTPRATGTRTAAVSIADNAPDSPQTLPLTGVGTLPIVTLSPPSLSFGPQPVGTTSQPQIVELSTSGSLSITSITTSAEFVQTNNCSSSLPAGGSCQISVTFTPTATGVQNGTLTVSDSGASSPQTASLSGTGTQPAVTLYPASLNFGNQTVGITSTPKVSTLTNTGNGTLTITSIGVTGSDSSEFAETNTCGASVPAGGSCKITVTFTPTTTGTQTASVSITDNAPNSPQSLPLSGVGVLPAVTFSPTSLTFPTQVVYTSSKVQKVTLTNTGLGVLTITNISVSGQFSQTNTCGTTVKSKAKCTINVTFKPTTIGPLEGSVSVSDNAPGSPQGVTLNGTGTYIQLKPASLNFGTQPVGTTSLAKKITLTNKGDVTVNITDISITGTDAGDFAQTNTCGATVASGASCFFKVTFTPSAQGSRTARVSISDNGGGSPQLVDLSGKGTP